MPSHHPLAKSSSQSDAQHQNHQYEADVGALLQVKYSQSPPPPPFFFSEQHLGKGRQRITWHGGWKIPTTCSYIHCRQLEAMQFTSSAADTLGDSWRVLSAHPNCLTCNFSMYIKQKSEKFPLQPWSTAIPLGKKRPGSLEDVGASQVP